MRANGTTGILFVSQCAAYYHMEVLFKIQLHCFMYACIYLFILPNKIQFPPIKVISAYCVWRLLVLNSQWWVHINVKSSPLVTVGSLPRKQKGVFHFASKLILQGPCIRMKLHLSPIRGSIRF